MQTPTTRLLGPVTTPALALAALRKRVARMPRRVYRGGYVWVPLPVANTLCSAMASMGAAVQGAYAAMPVHVRTAVATHTATLASQGNVAAAHALLHMWGV